jgi:hypothetical protein
MQALKIQTFKNIQTGNVAEMLIDDSGVCIYYQEICAQGVVKAGHNQDEIFWASWTSEQGSVLKVSEWPCLDDALSRLEIVMGKSVSHTATASYYEDKLHSIKTNTAISSDDPDQCFGQQFRLTADQWFGLVE